MNKLTRLAFTCAGILILGVGCPQTQTKPADEYTSTPSESGGDTNDNTASEESGDIDLSGEAVGNGQVKFTWKTDKDLGEAQRFILVRSTEQDPEHSGKNHWFRMHGSKREILWTQNPTGTMHYRVCITQSDAFDTCDSYSNDVEVDVK